MVLSNKQNILFFIQVDYVLLMCLEHLIGKGMTHSFCYIYWGVIIILVDQLPRTLGELKQSIMRENNLVNQLIFKVGLTEQQISLMDNKIIIIAKHKRIPVLEIIESSSDSLAEIIDRLLIDKYKELLLRNLEEKLHFNVQLILKDYDSMKEISGTIIVLDKKIESYLAG